MQNVECGQKKMLIFAQRIKKKWQEKHDKQIKEEEEEKKGIKW